VLALAASALLSGPAPGCDQFASIGVQGGAGAAAEPAIDAGSVTSAHDAGSDAAIDAGQCAEVAIAVCDPVKNKYCDPNFAMQCAIDLLNPLTGYCIFSAPTSVLGGGCLNSGVTETCPPRSTCFSGTCATICLCDADCAAGSCCSEPVGDTGFSVCGEC
jgi:hypothetical protein